MQPYPRRSEEGTFCKGNIFIGKNKTFFLFFHYERVNTHTREKYKVHYLC